jgi:hypothetical protein
MTSIAWLWFAGCAHPTGGDTDRTPAGTAIAFVTGPTLTENDVAEAPLAWRLQATLDHPATVTVAITDGVDSWTRGPFEVTADLDEWLFRWYPGETHTVTVTATGAAGTSTSSTLTVTAPPLPDDFPDLELVSSDPDRMEPGLTVAAPSKSAHDAPQYIVAVDALGIPVWWYAAAPTIWGFEPIEGGFRYILNRDSVNDVDYRGHLYRVLAAEAEQQADETPVSVPAFHHNVHTLPDGHLLVLSIEGREIAEFPQRERNPSLLGPAMVAGDVLLELDVDTGDVVQQWNLLDILQQQRIGYGALTEGYWDPFFGDGTADWSHANAIAYDESTDRIWLSLRHQDAIVAIGRTSGELEWILGDADKWQEPWRSSLAELTSGNWQYHQHGISLGPDGDVMAFDNGNDRAIPPKPPLDVTFSRAVQFHLDEEDHTAAQAWSYHDPRGFVVLSQGNVQYLPVTDHVLVNFGNLSAVTGPTAEILETPHDQSEEILFELALYPPTEDTDKEIFVAFRIPEF